MFDISSAALLSAGHLSPNPEWSMSVHAHPDWEFVYFLGGSGRVETPHASYHAQRYSLLVYPPGLPHAETSSRIDPEETVFLMVRVAGQAPAGAHLLLSDPSGDMGWLCRRVLAECQASRSSGLAQRYTQAFLHLVERAWDEGIAVGHDAVDTAIQFMHDNYSREITLQQLAHLACVSKTHFAHCFANRAGASPMRYLQRLRVERAKRLLITSDRPVSEVARLVGFGDAFHFSKTFKSLVGCSPKAFRAASFQQPGTNPR